MPKIIRQQVNCPNCRSKTHVKLWTSINPQLAPGLRKKIMNETLFDFFCPRCQYKSHLQYPFLYNDMKHNFMLYFIPYAKKDRVDFPEVQRNYPQLNKRIKRLVKDLNHMKEKIIIFENGLDDKAIEFTKYSLEKVILKKTNKYVESSYFCMFDKQEKRIGFVFFFNDKEDPLYHVTTLEAYDKYINTMKKTNAFDDIKKGFLAIDQKWVRAVLKKR